MGNLCTWVGASLESARPRFGPTVSSKEAVMNLLDPKELKRLLPAETHSYPAPVPTQSVSSDELMPYPQTRAQRRVEARMKELGGDLARRQGMTRRRFFQTAAGIAAAFLVRHEGVCRL